MNRFPCSTYVGALGGPISHLHQTIAQIRDGMSSLQMLVGLHQQVELQGLRAFQEVPSGGFCGSPLVSLKIHRKGSTVKETSLHKQFHFNGASLLMGRPEKLNKFRVTHWCREMRLFCRGCLEHFLNQKKAARPTEGIKEVFFVASGMLVNIVDRKA